MVKPAERTLKKKFRRRAKGKATEYFEREKKGKKKCALCGTGIAGTKKAGKARKESKSQKRPSAPFGGELCNRCRHAVVQEAIKVREGIKKESDVGMKQRRLVKILSEKK